jgi:hypothetical protein
LGIPVRASQSSSTILKKGKIMRRPTSVTVFGILNIVFSAFGFFGVLATVVMLGMAGTNPDNPALNSNPVLQLIQNSPAYATWLKFSMGLTIIFSGALLAAGIGLLNLLSWARILSMIYGVFAIIMTVVSTAFNYVLLVQPLLEKVQNEHGPEAAGAMGGAIGGTFSCTAETSYFLPGHGLHRVPIPSLWNHPGYFRHHHSYARSGETTLFSRSAGFRSLTS